jgi:hypothetical protein
MQGTKRKIRKRNEGLDIVPNNVKSIEDLITIAQTGKIYSNIETELLWKILPQLIEINNMVGMKSLKDTLFYQIIYYLLGLSSGDENDYLHTVIMGPPGSGKCLGLGTKVVMYDKSIKNVEDLSIGDRLMGDDSKPRTVLSLCQGVDKLYKIIYPSGHFIVNKAHLLSLIREDEFIELDVVSLLTENLDNYKLYKKKIVFDSYDDLGLEPYVFGYVLGGGIIVNENVIITIDNPIILDYLASYVHKVDEHIYQIIDNKYLEKLDVNIINYNPSQLLDILAGIIDAVGVATVDQIVFEESKDYIISIVKTISDICLIPYTITKTKFHLKIDTTDTFKITKKLSLEEPFKYCRSKRYQWDKPTILDVLPFPFTIEPTSRDEDFYYGFELDGENGRFVLEDFTITHNTTIAKIIGEMYKNIGILSPDGKFRVAKREDFIAEYLGQTTIKTKKFLESCIGGVLFIDEVYALGPGKNDQDSFSKEAIDTLNVFLSENCNTCCCIVAGYEDDIKNCFFSVNQGLRRRFQWSHKIGNYSIQELIDIFYKLLSETKWFTDVDRKDFEAILMRNKSLFVSAGGDIENLITKCKMAHANRILSVRNPSKFMLTLEDVLQAIEIMKLNKIDEEDNQHVLSMYT